MQTAELLEVRPILTPRETVDSVDDLLPRQTGLSVQRQPMKTADSLSGSSFERLEVGNERFVVKHLHVDDDWVARTTGDLTCRPLQCWRSGLLDALPTCIDHAIVGVAGGLGRDALGAALLLRDVGDNLVVNGPLTLAQHEQFVQHMAELHATFWGWEDTVGLQPLGNRLFMLTPTTTDVEARLKGDDVVPPLIRPGWRHLLADAPVSGGLAWDLLADPAPILRPLSRGPQTFIHGDWKAGNLGVTPQGRTILLDWALPGQGPGLLDLAWYLAVNCDRLPESKEVTLSRYRKALEARGISTDGWWEEQVGLALIFGFVQMGWSKQGEELEWWDQKVKESASFLN